VRLPFFYGWIVVGIASVTMALAVNARTAFSLLFPPILDEFGWERGVTAGAFSMGFLVSTIFTPWMGSFMDRRGPRWVMGLGGLSLAAGLALAPLVTRPWHLYLTLGVLVAGGTIACGYTGHSVFLPNWFVRRRGLAIGIAFSGVGVGSIFMMPWLQGLIATGGWRRACWTAAAVVMLTLVPLNLLQRRKPEDIGLHPDGDTVVVDATARAHPANVVDPVWASTDWTLGRAVRTARFWWIALGFLSGLFTWYAVQVHQTKYLLDIGFAPGLAAWALGLVGFAGIAGQIGVGYLSDRIGREWVWTLSSVGFALCYTVLLVMRYYPTSTLLYAMVIVQGLLG
jgi:MFS family permease